MHRLRSHIIRLFAISILWIGLGLYIVQPAQGKNSTRSFAHWFSSIAQEGETASLAKELNRLRASGVDLSGLIEFASEFISENTEGFKLPIKGASGSQQIYQILLQQWSHFQTGNGMANVPPPETVKTGISLKVDKFSTLQLGNTGVQNLVAGTERAADAFMVRACHENILSPMATGIAIGAP